MGRQALSLDLLFQGCEFRYASHANDLFLANPAAELRKADKPTVSAPRLLAKTSAICSHRIRKCSDCQQKCQQAKMKKLRNRADLGREILPSTNVDI